MPPRYILLVLWAVAVLLAGASLGRMLAVAADQLAAPFDLMYETPNLRTIQLLQAGRSIYATEVYAAPPFWLTIYTPAYHYVVSWLPPSTTNPFLPGRLVAMACMLLAPIATFAVARTQAWAATLAVGVWFLLHTVVCSTAFLKNDSMAVLLAALAVVCAAETRGPRWLVLSSACAAAAFFTKQSFLAAPAAVLLFLLLRDRRRAIQFAAVTAALLGAGLALSAAAWGSGFFFSVFGALRNPMSARQFVEQWRLMGTEPLFVAVFALAAAEAVRAAVVGRLRALTGSPYLLYLIAAVGVLCATLGKTGSSSNYFFEPVLAALLWLVYSVRGPAGEGSSIPWRVRGAVALLVVLGVADLARAPHSDYSYTDRATRRAVASKLREAAAEIRSLGTAEPRILNLAWASLSHPLPGEICLNDPYLYSLLLASGQLSPRAIIEPVARLEFDGILVSKMPSRTVFPRAVWDAVESKYLPALDYDDFVYLVPRGRMDPVGQPR